MAIKMIWSLCLLCVAGGLRSVHAGPIRNSSKMEDKAAPQEEVNVLMYGAIQLSESLSHVYETTGTKIEKIQQTLKSHEGTLQKLQKQTELVAEEEKQIKEVIELLQVRKHRNMHVIGVSSEAEALHYYTAGRHSVRKRS